jgi:hypothetical protein
VECKPEKIHIREELVGAAGDNSSVESAIIGIHIWNCYRAHPNPFLLTATPLNSWILPVYAHCETQTQTQITV